MRVCVVLSFLCEFSKGYNGLMQADHVPATISCWFFSVSACDIKCFETEIVLLINNLCE